MTVTARILLSCAATVLIGCEALPPVVLEPELRTAGELAEERPNAIAVLPIDDASPTRGVTSMVGQLRRHVARALAAQRGYVPLDSRWVDARVGGSVGSVVDASYLASLGPQCEDADALLGIQVTRWDDSSIMEDARVAFTAHVQLVSSRSKKVLWGGVVSGSVKAGGDGPAPLQRDARQAAAVEEFAWALISQLPARSL